MFILEALQAKHGDCLLLHWGQDDERHLAVIDGGPNTVYDGVLKPRLEELAGGRTGSLGVDLLMVSHIDDDHINGLLDFGDDMIAGNSPATVDLLWFNSLEGLLDGELTFNQQGATASLDGTFPIDDTNEWGRKVLASVPQGQRLDAIAKRLGLHDERNAPYSPLILRGQEPRAADVAGLELIPVAPDVRSVEELRKVWKVKRKDGVTAGYDDKSPYNLSSIVVIAAFRGRTMLLTGDALGSHIIDGLVAVDHPQVDGRWHFDVLKLPHHGSRNNVTEAFFRQITADHYVVSGDCARFPNPSEDAMTWLAQARGDERYTISCTYDLPHMHEIFGSRLRVPVRGKKSVSVSLED